MANFTAIDREGRAWIFIEEFTDLVRDGCSVERRRGGGLFAPGGWSPADRFFNAGAPVGFGRVGAKTIERAVAAKACEGCGSGHWHGGDFVRSEAVGRFAQDFGVVVAADEFCGFGECWCLAETEHEVRAY